MKYKTIILSSLAICSVNQPVSANNKNFWNNLQFYTISFGTAFLSYNFFKNPQKTLTNVGIITLATYFGYYLYNKYDYNRTLNNAEKKEYITLKIKKIPIFSNINLDKLHRDTKLSINKLFKNSNTKSTINKKIKLNDIQTQLNTILKNKDDSKILTKQEINDYYGKIEKDKTIKTILMSYQTKNPSYNTKIKIDTLNTAILKDYQKLYCICKNNDKLYIWQLEMKNLKLNDQSLINFEKKLKKLKD